MARSRTYRVAEVARISGVSVRALHHWIEAAPLTAGALSYCESQVTRPQGGYFLWLQLPKTVKALELFKLAGGKVLIVKGVEVLEADTEL